jgi:alpha-L-fucosidase
MLTRTQLLNPQLLNPCLVLLLLAACTHAQEVQNKTSDYQPSPENLEARRWFQDAKFGMFIHWGIYSELGDGEWVMERHKIPAHDYEKVAKQFYPVRYDPKIWVAAAKAAGMKYITVTTRHHDGFAMFQTRMSDWNVVDRSPYGKDVIRQLVDECHRQGIKIFFYYSQLDWHHPDYYPLGRTGHTAGRPEGGDWPKYLNFINGQLTELLSNYGEIGGIWFDGMWDKPDADWQLDTTYSLIHRLQPQALIIPNHHQSPRRGEDAQTFERDLPGQNSAGFNKAAPGNVPYETCNTMNKSWGFNLMDDAYKSPRQLVHYLASAAGRNANLLLNIGPMPDGELPPEALDRLHELGQWTTKYGDSIYGTRGGPVPPAAWGVTTQKGSKIYVHVLEDPGSSPLTLPKMEKSVRAASLLRDGSKVQFNENDSGVSLKLPARQADEFDQVIVLDLADGTRSKN